jgi:hypothetical protein
MPVVTPAPVAMPQWTDNDVRELGRLALDLDVDPEWIAVVMYSESALRPDACFAWNCTSTAARGLIQFLPSTLKSMFGMSDASIADFPNWSVERQLPYVARYLWSNVKYAKRTPNSAGAIYQGVFYPASYANGSNPTSVIVATPNVAYTQNKALDTDGNGTITVGDLEAHLNVVRKASAYQAFVTRLRFVTGAPPRQPWLLPTPKAPVVVAWSALALVLATATLTGVIVWRD